MRGKELLKSRMSDKEMEDVFKQNSAYIPTPSRVGRFAREIGYVRTKQIVGGRRIYFYTVNEDASNAHPVPRRQEEPKPSISISKAEELASFNPGYRLMGSITDQAVFMYFWVMSLPLLLRGEKSFIELNCSAIERYRGLDRKTAMKSIERLQKIRLINVDNRNIIVNARRYLGMLRIFRKLRSLEFVKKFIKAANECDDETLKDFGYTEDFDIAEELNMYRSIL